MRRDERTPWQGVGDCLLVAVVAVVAAGLVDLVLRFHWSPHTVEHEDRVVLSYPASVVWIIAGFGAALVVAGLRLGLARQFHNWLIVGVGAGALTLGTTFAAREQVVLTPEEFAVRRWWGFESREWRYADLHAITVVAHHRRRSTRWMTVRVERTGQTGTEEYGVPRLLEAAQLTLQTQARAKGVHVGWALDSRRW